MAGEAVVLLAGADEVAPGVVIVFLVVVLRDDVGTLSTIVDVVGTVVCPCVVCTFVVCPDVVCPDVVWFCVVWAGVVVCCELAAIIKCVTIAP